MIGSEVDSEGHFKTFVIYTQSFYFSLLVIFVFFGNNIDFVATISQTSTNKTTASPLDCCGRSQWRFGQEKDLPESLESLRRKFVAQGIYYLWIRPKLQDPRGTTQASLSPLDQDGSQPTGSGELFGKMLLLFRKNVSCHRRRRCCSQHPFLFVVSCFLISFCILYL